MILVGQVIDSVTKEPLVGANIYVSDSKGNPKGKVVSADTNGRYKLDNVSPTDNIASQMVSYGKKITSVKNAITMPNGFKALLISLSQGKEATLGEVVIKPKDEKTKISTKGDVKVETTKDEKVKEPMKLWVKIALGVGAVTVLGIIIFLATKEDKKGKK